MSLVLCIADLTTLELQTVTKIPEIECESERPL